MKINLRKKIKSFVPPIIQKQIDNLRGRNRYGFKGDFKSWREAESLCSGYGDHAILEKVKTAALKVRDGQSAFERDSANFEKIQYSWPLLACLLWIAGQNGSSLSLVDFGGSLGSSYYQNLKFLKHLKLLRWSVIEQPNFAECGKKNFENEHLRFYKNLKECAEKEKPNAVLLSSVLQYLENPYAVLREILDFGFDYLIFDRTTFLRNPEAPDRITIQTVPPKIYSASYPAWFFSEPKFLKTMSEKYELIEEFPALSGEINLGGAEAIDKGFLFKKIGRN